VSTEVRGEWRKLHDEELYNLFSTTIGGAGSTHGRRDKRVQNFSLKTWRQKPLGRPRHRWEDDIKMYLKEI